MYHRHKHQIWALKLEIHVSSQWWRRLRAVVFPGVSWRSQLHWKLRRLGRWRLFLGQILVSRDTSDSFSCDANALTWALLRCSNIFVRVSTCKQESVLESAKVLEVLHATSARRTRMASWSQVTIFTFPTVVWIVDAVHANPTVRPTFGASRMPTTTWSARARMRVDIRGMWRIWVQCAARESLLAIAHRSSSGQTEWIRMSQTALSSPPASTICVVMANLRVTEPRWRLSEHWRAAGQIHVGRDFKQRSPGTSCAAARAALALGDAPAYQVLETQSLSLLTMRWTA